LNRVIDFAHENRLTRHQQVMFALADMMAHVEVADSMARLAVKEADKPPWPRLGCLPTPVPGWWQRSPAQSFWGPAVGTGAADEFLVSLDLPALECSYRGLIDDMDRIADRIFERAA
jgi:hypothetical protein